LDVILDVDPGVDDALAILLALSSPELCVLGVTTVSGNVPLDRGTDNALRILAFCGRSDVPVYRGADQPLQKMKVHAEEVHGETGLGSACLPDADFEARDGAVSFLCKTLSEREGEITVVAVGPLTNLALAERQAPGILAKARNVVVMGGAVAEPGNVTPTAEFNFFADPDAAQRVLASTDNVVLIPLDVTHRVGIPKADIVGRLARKATERTRFFEQATRAVVNYGKRTGGYEGMFLHDPTAVAFVLRPDLFGVETVFADVEVEGALTAGQLVVDGRDVAEAERKGFPTRVAMEVDANPVLRLFEERVFDD
jgi:purine nucleosidase